MTKGQDKRVPNVPSCKNVSNKIDGMILDYNPKYKMNIGEFILI